MVFLVLALEVLSVKVVGRPAADAVWSDAPTEARLADGPELAVVVIGRERGHRVVVVDDEVAPLVLGHERGRRVVVAAERRPFAALGATRVRWSKVEPHAWRKDGRWHSNVSTDPASFGRWLGYDPIEYFETPLDTRARRLRADARPTRREEDLHGGLGTMRYKVELTLADGRVLASPGREAVDPHGILPSVHRVSIREGDDYLGWLSSYFLVPEVFGSAGAGKDNQTERFVGADCADVLTGALRRMGHGRARYTNVANLPAYASPIAGPVMLDERGIPLEPIQGVRAGDVIRIDYGGELTGHTPRTWDHVAVLWRDRSDPAGPRRGGPDGRLDGFDLVVHMGHPRLVVEPLSEQSPARIDVLRWDERRLGKARAMP